ncbi:unnamed protein product [Prunus armeniaca]
MDEISRIRKSTILESLVKFCDAIKTLYTKDYLCKPTPKDLQKDEAQGSQKDLNVLGQSLMFNDVLRAQALQITYEINNIVYEGGYYQGDGIYPKWMTFVKTISHLQSEKEKSFVAY